MLRRSFCIGIVMLTFCGLLNAQTLPEYNMSNLTVYDCEGILLDSEALLGGSTYGHNENYTFKICTGGKITMTFNSVFKTENGIDTLRFFDGPDTLSPQIGSTHSGTTAPPTVVANSGCLTVNFKSDNSVAYAGWEAMWKSEHVPPIPPTMIVYPVPNCNTTSISLLFDKKVACSPIALTDFTIYGPQTLSVTSIASSQCTSIGDSTTVLNLGISPSININCDYAVEFNLGIKDNCDSIWYFTLIDTFRVNTCPFNVEIVATEDTICPGTCTELEAIITGNPGNCLSFSYNWNNGLPSTPGPHLVCPSANTTYNVSVQLHGGGPMATDSKTIYHVDPLITSPDSMQYCQSDTTVALTATPTGGLFTGPGVVDGINGIFDPSVAGGGQHTIYYNLTGLCRDSIVIIVNPIFVGLDQAACPGVTPFMVSGFYPNGGVWSGDSISPSGIFNPAVPGSYTITYTVNGCSDSKVINVDTIILNTQIDTVCESEDTIHLMITPFGGIWSGPGIIDTVLGIFDPGLANLGANVITYSLSGCDFNIDIYVKEIDAGNAIVGCPIAPPYVLTPAARPPGGTWIGAGILNATTGLYDPSVKYNSQNGDDTLIYMAANGCKDEKIIYLRKTELGMDTIYHCLNDTAMELNFSTVGRVPSSGIYTGNGIQRIGTPYYFNPALAGVGVHTITYSRNNCSDDMIMIVHPIKINAIDRTVCNTHPTFSLGTMPYGGKWKGPGINSNTGVFNPSQAQIGTNIITYESPTNCVNDSVFIAVYDYKKANISGIDSVMCYVDSMYPLDLTPKNGKLTGPGTNDTTYTFNPAVAGPGSHVLTYEFGSGYCKTATLRTIEVLPELVTDVSVTKEEVCIGEGSEISIFPSGGHPDNSYSYVWSDGLFPQNKNTVIPTTTTTYVITTSDGCSDPVVDSITIKVAEEFQLSLSSGEKKCLGEGNYARIQVLGNSEYDYLWDGPKKFKTDSIVAKAGEIYRIKITDKSTGCEKDTLIKIPGFPNVTANFTLNPNLECIPSNRKNVSFIDLSTNGITGTWDFGTGDSVTYVYGENPTYQYQESGYYTVRLTIQNEGGCEDSFEKTICVQDIRPVFVADAFTPNGDGVNDVLHVKGKGFKEIYFAIYNKHGRLVFESNDVNKGWNGEYKGEPAETGVYIYVVSAKLINNENTTMKGNVSLIR